MKTRIIKFLLGDSALVKQFLDALRFRAKALSAGARADYLREALADAEDARDEYVLLYDSVHIGIEETRWDGFDF